MHSMCRRCDWALLATARLLRLLHPHGSVLHACICQGMWAVFATGAVAEVAPTQQLSRSAWLPATNRHTTRSCRSLQGSTMGNGAVVLTRNCCTVRSVLNMSSSPPGQYSDRKRRAVKAAPSKSCTLWGRQSEPEHGRCDIGSGAVQQVFNR